MPATSSRIIYTGIGLALLAVIIWSGNFIVARGVIHQVPPVSLAFYRWLLASLIIIPIAFNSFRKDWQVISRSWHYLFWVALTGVAVFNTFVYFGAHYTSAINLALIGTTSSPIFAILLALPALCMYVAIQTARGKKKFLPPMTTWFAAVLFAILPLRNILPGAPPPGVWIDQAIVLWVLITLVTAMIIYFIGWHRDAD